MSDPNIGDEIIIVAHSQGNAIGRAYIERHSTAYLYNETVK